MHAGWQFAPTYHEYVLYSNGSQDAPQAYKMRTLMSMEQAGQGPGMEVARNFMSASWQPTLSYMEPEGAIEVLRRSNEVPHTTATAERQQESIPAASSNVCTVAMSMFGQIVTNLVDNRASGSRIKIALNGSKSNKSFSDDDFNPRASLSSLDAQGAALLQHDPLTASYLRWGKSFEGSPQRLDSHHESSSEDEATELTKLTDRRVSEHGPLMDTIDR
jgi:hypothetical protein